MSDPSAFGFGKFVPGFDFLQNLGQAANPGAKGSPQGMPNMASWVAPTLSVEELDKRIQELKTVQFWLEQNTNALKATIQALEVQKMTLSTLQGMNVNMTELAKAFTAKMPDLQPKDTAKSEEAHSATGSSSDQAKASDQGTAQGATQGPAVDPMQWWGSLTQQFQNIAAAAVKDVAAKAMKDGPKSAKKRAATSKTRKPSASATRSASTRSSSARPSRAKKPAP
ncbi:MAG: PhaM family polyhydroxyalkanoate granule multifunctional regulatory protein [Burkholderiales bacterium]